MEKSDVSIVIPTFNRAGLIGDAIRTALAQSYPCEVIVVDHGSTDNTAEVVAGFGGAVRYVRKATDDGPFIAWLDGIIQATGKFIHITYDDDWIAPEFVARCREAMADDVGIVFTDAMVVTGERQSRVNTGKKLADGVNPSSILLRRLLRTRFAISPGCALMRRKDALDALMTNPVRPLSAYRGVGPDLMLYLLPALRYPKFAYVNEPLAFFRAHEGSITADAAADRSCKKALIRGYREYQAFFRLAMLQGHRWLRTIALAIARMAG